MAVVKHCFPDLNAWFDALPDPRRQDLCVYLGRHIWWEIALTFLLRNGSRNEFDGDIGPKAATLWCWVTNLRLSPERVYAIANKGGRARNGIENVFNVEKNGGFGLEHAFCANTTASQNYHLIMQVAHTLGQLLVKGLLHRLTMACRKVSDIKLIALLRMSLLSVRITTDPPELGQIRFYPSG